MQRLLSPTLFIVFIGIVLLSSCIHHNIQEDLLGDWQAVQVLEENQPLDVDVQQIKISFSLKQSYQYQSTLKYKEAGSYRLQSNLLLTKDTLSKNAIEKAVEIAKISQDSLFLRMNEEGKERILVMVRTH